MDGTEDGGWMVLRVDGTEDGGWMVLRMEGGWY